MQSLFSAKERVRERSRASAPSHRVSPTPIIPEPPTLGMPGPQAQELQSMTAEGEESSRPAAAPRPQAAPQRGEQAEETLAARLRRARERR
jgi:hypothetical protein